MSDGDAIKLAVAAVTDPGLKREINEDSYLAESPVFLVADGMGGYEAGDRASAAVVAAFTKLAGRDFAELTDIRDALLAADDGVAAVAGETTRGAGSTVSGLALVKQDGIPCWLVFNVGDSRVYRHMGAELTQLTTDHSLGQELIERGELRREDLQTFPNRNVITRAIGAADSMADSWLVPLINGERMLVCSDGLHSELDDESIRAVLTMSGRPETAAQALVDRAKQHGGRDNISIIVLDVLSGGRDAGSDSMTGSSLTGAPVEADADTIPV
ncbi:MAG: protein phosphatase 2C domain-containing protein [Pseudolysinimonas sp.]|uniref:PP2C family protein-serine/threonine phosphatase n=1 Tax=Pseudolysinimonas sp. TaxID=2680009 RepID=UPI00326324D7